MKRKLLVFLLSLLMLGATAAAVSACKVCLHRGGTATCTEQAVCVVCHEAYGKLDLTTHGNLVWQTTATAHSEKCVGCGTVTQQEAAHTFVDGVCSVCNYGCQHSGGAATCVKAAICEKCDTPYGGYDNTKHSALIWQTTAEHHVQSCAGCGAVTKQAAHAFVDGVCSVCEYVCAHTGEAATCTEQVRCAACGITTAMPNENNHTGTIVWEKTAEKHKKYYSCCGTVVVDEIAHAWNNGTCSVCTYVCEHSGGTATCTGKAVCETCGGEYGALNAANHSDLIWQTNGEYHVQSCEGCGTVTKQESAHTFVGGVCSECEYACAHTEAVATCTQKATCGLCGTVTADINENNHSGVPVWEKTAEKHKKYYSCCGAAVINEIAHAWNNGTCSVCAYVCEHSGGTADCGNAAVCEACGNAYGAPNAENHAAEPVWRQTATTHVRYYACCDQAIGTADAHDWQNGACTQCEYVCEHTGGTATCQQAAECVYCGENYGAYDVRNHTQEAVLETTATTHSKYYPCCGAVAIPLSSHDWIGDACAVCEYVCQHSGGTATCNEKARCELCGRAYGGFDEENHAAAPIWGQAATTHTKYYACCDAILGESAAHEWQDGVCSVCDYTCLHSGGIATCQTVATCARCGEEYGSLDTQNHVVAPTWEKTASTHRKYYDCCGSVAISGSHVWDGDECAVCDYVCAHSGGTATCNKRAICQKCHNEYGDLNSATHGAAATWKATANGHCRYYDCCQTVASATSAHVWSNGKCTTCQYVCAHSGGTATCREKPVCQHCGAVYGTKNADNHTGALKWKATTTSHVRYYACCDVTVGEEGNHVWLDGACAVCEYAISGSPVLTATALKNIYQQGAQLSIPQGTITVADETADAVTTVVFPSGTEQTATKVTLTETGAYTVRYSAAIAGNLYTQERYFEVLVDASRPVITVDFEEYTQSTIPKALVGHPYRLFAATAVSASCGEVPVSVKVYANYYTTRDEVAITDSAFTPTAAGAYVVIYRSGDDYGQEVTKQVNITAVATYSAITITRGDSVASGTAGYPVTVAQPTVKNALGTAQISIVYTLGGDSPVAVENGEFSPKKGGTYTVTITATDYIGRTQTLSYTVVVAAGAQPIFSDVPNLPDTFVAGYTYTLPQIEAYNYTDGSGNKVTVNISAIRGSTTTTISGGTYTPTASANGEIVTIRYAATVAAGTAEWTKDIPVVLPKVGSALHMENYLLTTGSGVSVAAGSSALTMSFTNATSSAYWAVPLVVGGLKVQFAPADGNATYNAVCLTLTDSVNASQSVTIVYERASGGTKVYAKSKKTTYVTAAQTMSSGTVLTLEYDAVEKAVKYDPTVSNLLSITKTDGGEDFTGFDSGKVYVAFRVEQVTGTAKVNLVSLMGQTVNNATTDKLAPHIGINGTYGGTVEKGEVITLNPGVVADLVDPLVKCYVTVKAPDGSCPVADGGVQLSGAAGENKYTFVAKICGTYRVTYRATDAAGNVALQLAYQITVPDVDKPVITVSKNVTQTGSVGTAIAIPSYTVKDNISDVAEITAGVMVIDPDGNWDMIDSGTSTFTPTRKGKYVVRYFAYDAAGNFNLLDFVVTVR